MHTEKTPIRMHTKRTGISVQKTDSTYIAKSLHGGKIEFEFCYIKFKFNFPVNLGQFPTRNPNKIIHGPLWDQGPLKH